MWTSNATRPDIANAVREVARQAHNPSKKYWQPVPSIIECLRGTQKKGIGYKKSTALGLTAYCTDSSFVDNVQDRRPVPEGVVLLAGGLSLGFAERNTA